MNYGPVSKFPMTGGDPMTPKDLNGGCSMPPNGMGVSPAYGGISTVPKERHGGIPVYVMAAKFSTAGRSVQSFTA